MATPGRRGDHEPVYTIGVAERMTGLSARQIRYYELRGLIKPRRSSGNQRLYSRAQIDRLKVVKALRQQQMPLEAIMTLLEEEPREDVEK